MKVYSLEEIQGLFKAEPNKNLWTVVIPAAGKGTRLGYSKAKILYPILGRTVLDRLIDLLEPHCSKFFFILSPAAASDVLPILNERLPGRFEAPIIADSRGMADSIYQAVPHLSTPYTLIIWGDQVAISPQTICMVQKLQQSIPEARLTLPLVKRENPYVHYMVDEAERLNSILEKREGKEMPAVGESDCGVFACDTRSLQEAYEREIENGITLSQMTKEWNFLPMLPFFETGGASVNAYRLESFEETVGVNDVNDVKLLEAYFQKLDQKNKQVKKGPLKVLMFSGGRGTGAITEALLKYPDIELTLLVNAYDDGLSTGLLRRFIPGMLGPSDVRKNISRFVQQRKDPASQALLFLLEYRFANPCATEDALATLKAFINISQSEPADDEVLRARESLSLSQIRTASRYLFAFLEYYEKHIESFPDFPFGDVSFGNLLFAGCYLANGEDFNRTVTDFSRFSEVGSHRVLNVTRGEGYVLVALKENGQYLYDEASIVSPQDAVRIQEIFLLPQYLPPDAVEAHPDTSRRIEFLRRAETFPDLNPEADKALREADIIIYGPGTQYSSLFPSYLTVGVAEAIQANTHAEKVFIANIARDYDILGEDATTLVKAFLWNMSRKATHPVTCQELVSNFFFQKPEKTASGEDSYVPFDAQAFEYPIEKVRWINWEEAKGKHSGSKTIWELLLIVENRLQKRVRHVSHKVSIIVPALNEERTIKRVLEDLKEVYFSELELEKEIIVVDGGSTDGTFEIANAEPDVRTYRVEGKRGRGRALLLGVQKAKGDIIVFFPSDGEYVAQDILRVVAPLVSQEFPVVLGSRAFHTNDLNDTLKRVYGKRGTLFLVSKYGGILLSILTLLLYQRFISDPFTTLRGFNARIFRGMRFARGGVDFDVELIAKIARRGHVILEVPVSYTARTVEEGKKTTPWDGLQCLWTLIRFSFWKPKK